jgi:hypothetical protein
MKNLKQMEHKTISEEVSKPDNSKIFWVVSSVDASVKRHGSRARAYWENLKDATDYVLNGWSDAEFFYESGYYTHVVVESMMLNHPLSSYVKDRKLYWFRFVVDGFGKVKTVRCKAPKVFSHVIGFGG